MSPIHKRSVIYASKTAAATLAAMLSALWLNLPHPGWAGLTVFLTSQQLGAVSGSVVSRSVYRVVGTALAAAGILLFIPIINAAPEMLLAGIATWVALLLYVSLLDRSPSSYVFLLAAYTLPLIGLSSANSPLSAFDTALWRVEEVALGAAVSVAVHTVFAPREVKPLMVARLSATLADAKHWILQGLGATPTDERAQQARTRLAADLTEARTLAAVLRFEPGIGARDMGVVISLEERALALLPLLAGVEERLAATRSADPALAVKIDQHLDAVRRHLEQPRDNGDAARLADSGRTLVDIGRTHLPDSELLALGAMERLAELLRTWDECLALMHQLENPAKAPDATIQRLMAVASPRVLHIDHGLAALSGLSAAVAVLCAGALCWALGWDQGAITVGLAAVGSCLFAFLDDPRPFLRLMMMATGLAVPVAALYVFAILPAVDGYLALAMVLAPLLFTSAFFLSIPKWTVPALGFTLVVVTLISVQPVQAGDFSSFIATAMGSLLGTTIALTVTSLVRVIAAATGVRRLMHAVWHDLADIADGQRSVTRAAWASRMMDRMGLLLPRMAAAQGPMRARAEHALDDLRLGVNMLDLRETALQVAPQPRAAIDAALLQLAAHFRQRLAQPDAAPGAAIARSINQVIADLNDIDPGPHRSQGLAAATGLRLALLAPAAAAAGAHGDNS
ncbi:FUSC family protein [Variovorax sp. J22R115]|uniref:FUSC family protein n=1 Tax=Variovorax sp. J22R115 TaxID=3053509 RepID=UPI0025772825|nr:FUSC family protein [Variovorax sp. J22R115]MDM0049956.1 FUSC family protein [Variovorax sp. J22R115]